MPIFYTAQPLGYSIQTAEIDSDAVTAAKIAQGTAGQILMSDATPDTNWKTMSGDATIDGSGVLTIGANKITQAMLQDDVVDLAELKAGTAGNLITYDASGNPAAVATGTATQILTSNGVGAAPTFQATSISGYTPKENRWTVMHDFTVANGSFAYEAYATEILQKVLTNSASATPIDDEITFPMTLEAGTYTIGVRCLGDSDTGIITVKEGANTLTTLDTYNVGSNAIVEQTGITISSNNTQTIHLVMATKNASSSNYRIRFAAFYMIRTGA